MAALRAFPCFAIHAARTYRHGTHTAHGGRMRDAFDKHSGSFVAVVLNVACRKKDGTGRRTYSLDGRKGRTPAASATPPPPLLPLASALARLYPPTYNATHVLPAAHASIACGRWGVETLFCGGLLPAAAQPLVRSGHRRRAEDNRRRVDHAGLAAVSSAPGMVQSYLDGTSRHAGGMVPYIDLLQRGNITVLYDASNSNYLLLYLMLYGHYRDKPCCCRTTYLDVIRLAGAER